MSMLKNADVMKHNELPGVRSYNDMGNPTLTSDYGAYDIAFAETRDSLMNSEDYSNFIKNSLQRFRHSVRYNNYKGFLIGLGLDRCQVHGNITNEMATIEMHHMTLTIFDIALIICEHILNTYGYITTFDLVYLLKQEHTNHRVNIVMMSKTVHQLYHNTDGLFIHPDQTIGKWWEFLELYSSGITMGVAQKVINYIDNCISNDKSYDSDLLKLREKIIDWSVYNERTFNASGHEYY